VAEPLLANGEPVMDGGAHRTADEREIAREIAGASEWPIKKSRKLGAES
jgi:hypothetical protein